VSLGLALAALLLLLAAVNNANRQILILGEADEETEGRGGGRDGYTSKEGLRMSSLSSTGVSSEGEISMRVSSCLTILRIT
jgi:hypothetical protein